MKKATTPTTAINTKGAAHPMSINRLMPPTTAPPTLSMALAVAMSLSMHGSHTGRSS